MKYSIFIYTPIFTYLCTSFSKDDTGVDTGDQPVHSCFCTAYMFTFRQLKLVREYDYHG